MKVYITGDSGFIGYHLRHYLKFVGGLDVLSKGERFQKDLEKIKSCDYIIHLAGVNRGEEIYEKNLEITKDLITSIKKLKIIPQIIFASSTQEGNKTPYGSSKSESYKLLISEFGEKRVEKIKIPNVFGPFCKPNYNSVVSTFCHALNNGTSPNIIEDKEIDLIYITELCLHIHSILIGERKEMVTKKMTVSILLEKLSKYNIDYRLSNTIPEFEDIFDLDLFNTFRSFSNPLRGLEKKIDERGFLIECMKSKNKNCHFFYSLTKPNVTRGNHFHFRKIERFIIIKGSAKIELQKPGGEKKTIFISENDNQVIDIPVLTAHNLKNIGTDDLICCFWSNEIFDPQNPDTYFLKIDE